MNTFGDIKQAVLGYVTRAQSSFQAGSQNMVPIAVNNAIMKAQRQHDFEWCKGVFSVECKPVGLVSNARNELGQTVLAKRVIKAFGTVQPTGHNDKSIPYLSRTSAIADATSLSKNAGMTMCTPAVIHDGLKVYVTPEPSKAYVAYFYGVLWLPKLVSDVDTNFLLDFGFDYLLYSALLELNFFIKEDERFNISKSMLAESWSTLLDWDSSLVSPTETEIEL